ncbi:MAG: hypothetical protein A2X22_03420 [Bacteroidetes bacterium GWF2_49_14]|nr:MAG: hypothetical protein A2X22_03420 [Bacteroidetes bacterium GWF2_49_14]HBB93748.1 hypothetical protein [Bacteroidales bacterium]
MDLVSKYRGLLGTGIFHAVLLILMFVLTINGSVIKPESEGITINFGTDETGQGAEEPPQQEVKQPEEPKVVATPEVKRQPPREQKKDAPPKILTQNLEDAATIQKQKEEKEEADRIKAEELERIREEAAEKRRRDEAERARLAEEQRKSDQVNAIKGRMGKSFGGNSSNTGTGSEGTAGKTGNQGDPTGSVSSSNRGPGGGQGAGISYSLDGRNVIGSLAKPEYTINDYGTVVVQITVNKDGAVVTAVPGAKGSTTMDSRLLEAAKKAAKTARFNKVTSPEAPTYQRGSITYHFKLL